MRTYNLSKSNREEVVAKIRELSPDVQLKLKDLKIAELDEQDLAIIFEPEERLYLGRKKGTIYFPLLKDEMMLPAMPFAIVDMGAVKFVVNGANVMRPGIVSFTGDFKKGDIVVVREASHQKAIAVGRAIDARSILEPMKKGPAVENLHWVGDKFWEALKSV